MDLLDPEFPSIRFLPLDLQEGLHSEERSFALGCCSGLEFVENRTSLLAIEGNHVIHVHRTARRIA